MKRLTILLGILFPFLAFGQAYDIAAGMRFGTDWGLTGQFRVADHITIEPIIQTSLQREEVMITVLGEKHAPLLFKRLNFYVGGGIHKGWLSNDPFEEDVRDPFGIDGVAGLEFTVARINLSYDIKPAFNLIGGEKRMYFQTGVSIRYVVDKRPIFDRNKKKKKKGSGIDWKFWE